jgi:rRNA processing protein Krr1/Pno1|eukprot:g3203.t1
MEQETVVLITLAACSIGTLALGAICSRSTKVEDDEAVEKSKGNTANRASSNSAPSKKKNSPKKKKKQKPVAASGKREKKDTKGKEPTRAPEGSAPSKTGAAKTDSKPNKKKSKKKSKAERAPESSVQKMEEPIDDGEAWSTVQKRPKTPRAPSPSKSPEKKPSRPERVVESIPIDDSDVGRLVGKAGANIKKIEKETGARLSISAGPPREVVIKGLPRQVEEAKGKVLESMKAGDKGKDLENAYKETIDLKTQQNRLALIGIKGSTIRRLEDQCGASFIVDRETNSVTIAGEETAVKRGKALVETLMRDISFERRVAIPTDRIGAVMGKGGARIRAVELESNARLKLKRANSSENKDAPATMVIMGTKNNVLKAEAMIMKLLETASEPLVEVKPGELKEERELGEAVSAVVGREGKNIRSIQAESGATIRIAKNATKCYIVGTRENIDEANKLIDEAIDRREKFKARAEKRKEAKQAATAEDADAGKETYVENPGDAGTEGAKPKPPPAIERRVSSSWADMADED